MSKIYTVEAAAARVCHLRGYPPEKAALLPVVLRLVYDHMPAEAGPVCAYALRRAGDVITYKITNYAVFQVQAVTLETDAPLQRDALLLWLPEAPLPHTVTEDAEARRAFTFAHFPCILLNLNLDEIAPLTAAEWDVFTAACRVALTRKNRLWPSNITF